MAVIAKQNKCLLRMHFRMGNRVTWTEKYVLGAGTPSGFLELARLACWLRSTWLGWPVALEYAAVSDLGSGRDSRAVTNYPSDGNVFAGQVADLVQDVHTAYEYRLQRADGYRATRAFRGNPGRFFSQGQPVGGAWAPNGTDLGKTGTIYAPFANDLPGVSHVPTSSWVRLASSWLNFLVQKTAMAVFDPAVPRWNIIGTWDQVLFRRVAARRTGMSWEGKRGRFSR